MTHTHYAATPLELVELKADSGGSMEFTAYASTFGNRDHGGDVIQKGAFTASLRHRKFRPLLWQHDMREPIGIEKMLREDSKGLIGTWQLVDTQRGRDAYALLKAGAVRAMSIGYLPTKWEFASDATDTDVTRVLKEIDLLENSVVSIPMNDQAQVTAVKHLTECTMCQELDHFKAEWSAAFINDLPDSAFAYIESGGKKDADGKTTPRSLRHFPHHGTGGAIDLPHLRNALARAPQSEFGSRAMPHLTRHARAEGVGEAGKEFDDDMKGEPAATEYDHLTLAEHASLLVKVSEAFGERTRDLIAKLEAGGYELTDAKRTDLHALLETFSGLDAVRPTLEAALAQAKLADEPEQVTAGEDPEPVGKSVRRLAIEMRRHRLRAAGVEV